MNRPETKVEYIIRAKGLLRKDLNSRSWSEKVRSIERMNAAKKIAQTSMRQALERERSKA